jgi:predicted nucleic acid-binding protein
VRRVQDLPPVCVIDANVLFDAATGGFLPELFSLDYVFLTTDIMVHDDVKSISLADLLILGLKIRELPGEQVLEMVELRGKYLTLSIQDISVMLLARHMGAVLLSGDGPLRKIAEQEGVVLHGTLWVLDLLVARGILSRARAAGAIETMQQNGRWLPGGECERRIRAWKPG